jgi:hypothetical protein
MKRLRTSSDNVLFQVLCKVFFVSLAVLLFLIPSVSLQPQQFTKTISSPRFRGSFQNSAFGATHMFTLASLVSSSLSVGMPTKTSDFVKKLHTSELAQDSVLVSSAPLEPKALPLLDWILDPSKKRLDRATELQADKQENVFARILSRIVQIQAHEENPHLRDDYQIAWLTVRYCETGEAVLCTPDVLATYRILGVHPAKVWRKIVERRNALLGPPIGVRQHATSKARREAPVEPAGAVAAASPIPKPAPVTVPRKPAHSVKNTEAA